MTDHERCKDEGDGALAIGDLEGAARLYRQSVESDPGYADGWHALGMVLLKRGMTGEAVAAARRAAELSPDDAMAWTSLSIALARANRIAEAEAAAAKARVISWGGKADAIPDAGAGLS
ncbi:MAG: tetratricopeptide repeat protein [Verrucomicrobiae bacterium]|nr:tetratricopeptide repeat protein [Verrucomicrobiae bacterium]